MQLIYFFLSLIGLFTLVAAIYDPGDLPYPAHEVYFNGTLGGHEVQLTGTVQEMMAQMKDLHPGFDWNATAIAARSEHMRLNSRQQVIAHPAGEICYPVPGQPWKPCDAYTIDDGVVYLYALQRYIGSGQGCGRISCSWNAAIWFCNDNPFNINIPSTTLGWYAEALRNDCWSNNWGGNGPKTGGQIFDAQSFNVIVRSDSC